MGESMNLKPRPNPAIAAVTTLAMQEFVKQLPALVEDLLDKILGEETYLTPKTAADPDPQKCVAIRTRIIWISRKNRPFNPQGGRHMLTSAEIDAITANPPTAFLHVTDRIGLQLTPFDSNGDGYGDNKPLTLIHNISGDVLLELDEQNDYSPVLVIPKNEGDIRPDFVGEFTYQVTSEEGIYDTALTFQIRHN